MSPLTARPASAPRRRRARLRPHILSGSDRRSGREMNLKRVCGVSPLYIKCSLLKVVAHNYEIKQLETVEGGRDSRAVGLIISSAAPAKPPLQRSRRPLSRILWWRTSRKTSAAFDVTHPRRRGRSRPLKVRTARREIHVNFYDRDRVRRRRASVRPDVCGLSPRPREEVTISNVAEVQTRVWRRAPSDANKNAYK
ncbi:hypothetical protein EVAR_44070_1 [Eumeta japonica]|uniref:Uncharacterized protein n=1 Tax=Eumeta variegata TaxID=151549 RepID=A0A4C1X263_EUMVA|nr:hypothetical protein EVAR_44070_1 [Eumeta japonica]